MMEFKIGDKVKLLNEIGEGEITKLGDNDIVYVMLEDGFDVPMKSNEIIKISQKDNFPGQETKEEKEEVLIKEESGKEEFELSNVDLLNKDNTKINLLLGLVPNRINHLAISDLDLYIINDSNYGIFYHIGKLNERNEVSKVATGTLEDNTKVYVQTFSQSDISKVKTLFLQAVTFGNQYYAFKDPIEIKFDLSTYDFYRPKSFEENEFFDTQAVILSVDGGSQYDLKKEIDKLKDTDYAKIVKQKGDSKPVEPEKPKNEKNNSGVEEVDLHIEEIVDNYKGLSNGEIVEIQLGRFETALEGAIRGNQNKIVFIHGVGNGRLKHELRKKLERKYSDLKYQDASFKEYGYGATMVYLK